ncbi:MAG: DUF2752 domain-containing protein [Deltaproteobacteria bacterium]|nr:MAG: DUF2752 domain-containing protein [Deltaproteobacteria bacterium]
MWREAVRRLQRPRTLLRASIAAAFAALFVAHVAHAVFGVDLLAALRFLPGCPFRAATGVACPGCGMTRAFLLLSQLRIGDAVAAHPASPLLALAMAVELVRPSLWPRLPREPLAAGLLVLVVGAWLARALPG